MAELARRCGLHRKGDLKDNSPRRGNRISTGDAVMATYDLVLQGPNNLRRLLHYDPDTSRFIWSENAEPLDLSVFARPQKIGFTLFLSPRPTQRVRAGPPKLSKSSWALGATTPVPIATSVRSPRIVRQTRAL